LFAFFFRSAVSQAKAELKGQKDALAANAKELASLNAQAEKIRKQKQEYELEIKKWNNETEKVMLEFNYQNHFTCAHVSNDFSSQESRVITSVNCNV
jgi:hypothetical protein